MCQLGCWAAAAELGWWVGVATCILPVIDPQFNFQEKEKAGKNLIAVHTWKSSPSYTVWRVSEREHSFSIQQN